MKANMETVDELMISRVKDRDRVLQLLVPKIFGMLNCRGQRLHGFGGRSMHINELIVLSVSRIDAHRLMVSVYNGRAPNLVKVLSLHVNDLPAAADPDFYRYLDGRVAVLNWRRGTWEDSIMAERS
jgi:hypothetical protein